MKNKQNDGFIPQGYSAGQTFEGYLSSIKAPQKQQAVNVDSISKEEVFKNRLTIKAHDN
jgi:hypothetical protein